jgi:hypothetical protein
MRFGDILENGRPESLERLVFPWEGGLGKILFSSGKGLLWFNPAILLGVGFWWKFHRQNRLLSTILLSALIFRIIFLTSFGMWDAGMCLGPRYLLMGIPFFLMPLGSVCDEWIAERRRISLHLFLGALFVSISQQLYFSVGEIFYFTHFIKMRGLERGFNVFQNDFIYVNWDVSPLFLLLNGKRGPFLLQGIPVNNYMLWCLLVSVAGIVLCWLHWHSIRKVWEVTS